MAANPACKTFRPKLSPFIDGELVPNERVEVERHLSVCQDCAALTDDYRAEAGLVRLGLDFVADEVDFRALTQGVLARVTPEKLPFWQRVKLSVSETFQYQRRAALISLATAAAVTLVVVPLALRSGPPTGYASEQLLVRDVQPGMERLVEPVVMQTDEGDTIIWMVEESATPYQKSDEDDEEDVVPRGGHPTEGDL